MLMILLNAAGGLALFMLAMAMMTDGLKAAAGGGLRDLLRGWTSSVLRGVAAGALITGVLQSSSAVLVAVIGFVNAGILSLRQALGVVFGANIGTTMTGWLVAATGIGFPVEHYALPVIALGVLLRFLASGKRLQGLGEALTGFGLFFLGLSVLKAAFAGVVETYGAEAFGFAAGGGPGPLVLLLLAGFAITVLTQSSSASIAIIFTAAAEGLIGLPGAAMAVIGANLGTTSTAAFATLTATANARRVAAGHIAFNLIAGAAALVLLPLMLMLAGWISHALTPGDSPAMMLAIFHTGFNILGLIVMLPFAGVLAARLERLFRTAEDDISRPRHLDITLRATPALALPAIRAELARLHDEAAALAGLALSPKPGARGALARRAVACRQLGRAITEFATRLRMQEMPRDEAESLPVMLRVGRYFEEAARLSPAALEARPAIAALGWAGARDAALEALNSARRAITLSAGPDDPGHASGREAALDAFETAYQLAKSEILRAAARGEAGPEAVDAALDALSHVRRLTEQMVKGDRLLDPETPARAAEPPGSPVSPA